MKTISEMQEGLLAISKQLAVMSDDLADFKNEASGAAGMMPDILEQIERQAQATPILNKKMISTNDRTRQTYMRFLAALAAGDEAKLLFARRISIGSGSDWNVDRLAGEGRNLGAGFIDSIVENLKDFRYTLLLDTLVMAHLSGAAQEKDLNFIADACAILQCSDEDIAIVAQVAAAVVQQDKSMFDKVVCKKPFHGLSHLIPSEWLKKIFVGTYVKESLYKNPYMTRSIQYKKAVESGIWVKEKQKIFEKLNPEYHAYTFMFSYWKSDKSPSIDVCAEVSGIVKYISTETSGEFQVYIYSPFDEEA